MITISNDLKKIGEFYFKWTGKSYNSDYMLFNAHFIVAIEDEQIVGAITLINIPDPFFNRYWGLIENVFVLPEYRQKGIATEMMRFAIDIAKGMGDNFVKLTTRKETGKALYRALGMQEGSAFYG